MKAKFIEDADNKLGLTFEPETDDERLLMRSFATQCVPNNLLRINGWGLGGENPGIRHIRVFQEREPGRLLDLAREACQIGMRSPDAQGRISTFVDEQYERLREIKAALTPTIEAQP